MTPLPTPQGPGHHLKAKQQRSRSESSVFYGVFCLLLLAPLAFGAVEPWAVYLLEVGASGLFMIWVVRRLRPDAPPLRWNSLFLPMLVFAGLVLFQIAAGRTAYRYVTVSTAHLYCAYGLICFLVVQCLRRTWQVRDVAIAFSAYGLAVATFALLQGLTSNGKLYWLRAPHGGGWIYGPYVNHNHYAGLMEMLLPVPLVFSLTRFATGASGRLLVLASVVIATTILLSGSRGGVIALVGEVAVLSVVLIRQRSRIPFRGRLAFALFLVSSLSLLGWIGGRKATERLSNAPSARLELTQGIRVLIDKDLVKMFPHRPLLGWGFGTFVNVYPQYRTFYSTLYLDEAHDDYLQLLIELGAFGFATMIWFVWLVFRGASKKLRNWSTDVDGAVAVAAILGVIGILVHSLVDFNLQVPANAALFYVLCTVAAMEPRFGQF
jgi:O-antigen ligase